MELSLEIPEKLSFLLRPCRYKGARGGRGSGKSWTFGRVLLSLGVSRKIRVLCTREVQKSIKQSVHKLLKDQIANMGLEHHYTVLDTEIRGVNGTEFHFSGLSDQTADSLKSFEGVDYCWIEEAQSITKRSLDILIPTIRKEGSEIWFSFNPDLETDEIYHRFVTNAPVDCICVECNYGDNPWFNDVLEKERLRCKEQYPDDYPNIWEGKCRPAVAGAIYYKEIESAKDQGRICRVPYDPMLKAHIVFDLGWNDAMAISIVQRQASSIRIIDYIEDSHRTLDDYSAELKLKRLNWGKVWLPHDGYSGDIKTGKSAADIMRKLGWNVPKREEIAEYSVENGIKVARMTFPRVYIDSEKCARLVECLKRYRRTMPNSGEPGKPLHDEYSHGADNFRYVCVNADLMRNEDDRRPAPMRSATYRPYDSALGL